MSPIAMPPRGAASGAVRPGGLNTPNGRFCSGNSAWPLAEATQLWRARSWVSSIMLNPPCHSNRRRILYRDQAARTRDLPAPHLVFGLKRIIAAWRDNVGGD